MASCCDYIICAHSVNFVHLTCQCEMSCMSGNTDCGGPKFCILNTDTYVGKVMKINAKKSPKVDFLRELVNSVFCSMLCCDQPLILDIQYA